MPKPKTKIDIIPAARPDLSNCAIDLYAGCGAYSLGFIRAGWKMLAALEFSPMAAQTYWHNLCLQGWSHLWIDESDKKTIEKFLSKKHEDPEYKSGEYDSIGWIKHFPPPEDNWITSSTYSPVLHFFLINILDLEPEQFMEMCGIKANEIGAVIGGPPCQGFSMAGERNIDDPRNQHIKRFLQYVFAIKPKSFLMENVPGMLTLGKQKGEKEGPFPKYVREQCEVNGYHLDYDIHNAADFGVPQNRKRVLFCGMRKDVYKGKKFHMTPTHNWNYWNHDEPEQKDLFHEKLEPYVIVQEAIGDLEDIHLGALQDKYAVKLPPGEQSRIPSNAYDADIFNFVGRNYYKDKFNGLYGYSNEVGAFWQKRKNRKHYKKCIHCEKINLKVRTLCHYCKKPPSLFIPSDMEIDIELSQSGENYGNLLYQ